MGPQPRGGRRPGRNDTKEDILRAARVSFGEHGFAGTTVRGVAAAASVDPALVHYFFTTKAGLFAAAMELPVNPADVLGELIAGDRDTLGERLVRFFVDIWDDPQSSAPLRAMVASATSNESAARALREFVGGQLLMRIASTIDHPDAELRATMAGSQLIGLAMARYIIGIEPLASAHPDVVVACLGPTLQRYLFDPDLPAAETVARSVAAEPVAQPAVARRR